MPLFEKASNLNIPHGTFSEVHRDMYYSQKSTTVNNIYFFGSDGIKLVEMQKLLASAGALNDRSTTLTAAVGGDTTVNLPDNSTPLEEQDPEPNVVDHTFGGGDLPASQSEVVIEQVPGSLSGYSPTSRSVSIPRPISAHDQNFTPTQITFIITLKTAISMEDSGQKIDLCKVAWQVFDVDAQNCYIRLKLPSHLGFGTVGYLEDNDEIVQSSQFLCGPPGSRVILTYENGMQWIPSDGLPEQDKYLRAQNMTGVSRKFAIGTYDVDSLLFLPCLVTGNIQNGRALCLDPQILLQAYVTEEVQTGQIITESTLSTSEGLFENDGIDIGNLQSITAWRVLRSERLGRLELEIEDAI